MACVCVRACVRACVCVFPPPRLLMTNGVICIHPIRLVSKFYNCYVATIVIIVNECGLGNDKRRGN